MLLTHLLLTHLHLTAANSDETPLKIQHLCLPCPWSSRAQTIGDMVLCYAGAHGRTIIFTETKKEANELALDEGIKVECAVLHGDIAQAQRETTFQAFRDGKFRCLVATDVAARGLDIPEIDLVIMCHPTKDPDTYVHRAGRTGRAGRSGVAVTFFTPRELSGLRLIERRIKTPMTQVSAPQPSDIVKANARDLRQSVGEVHEEVLPLFEHIAQEMIADMGAVKALCAAMAVACGHTKPLPSKSLLTSLEGFKTFVVALQEGGEPLQETRQLFPILRKVLPQHAVSSVRGLRLFKPAHRALGCAFDVPVDKVQVCVWRPQPVPTRSLCACESGRAFVRPCVFVSVAHFGERPARKRLHAGTQTQPHALCHQRGCLSLKTGLTEEGKQDFSKAPTPPGTLGIRAINAADELPPLQDPPNLGGDNAGARPAWGQQGAARRPSPGGGPGAGRPSPGGGGGGAGGRGGVGDGANDRKVFVGGLPFDADEPAVRQLFQGKGSIQRVTYLCYVKVTV